MAEDVTLDPNDAAEKATFCETPTGRQMLDLFAYCLNEGELGVVTGEPGLGKSTAARRFVAAGPRRYLVTVSPAASALVPCLQRVAMAVGARPSVTGAGALATAIMTKLGAELHQPVLVVDEAQHLSDQAIEELRSLFDAVPMGLVFVGSRELLGRWSGKRWAQLTSRISARLDLDSPDQDDINALCAHHGIQSKRARQLLRQAARDPGALRTVTKLIGVAGRLAAGKAIETAHIEDAVRVRGLV